MSDLSNLLGSVYGEGSPDGPPVQHEPAADDRGPAWADDARLDEAFENWTPGPGPDAGAHERDMMSTPDVEFPAPTDPDQDLAAALSAALAADRVEPAPPQAMHAPQPVMQAPQPAPMAPVAAMPSMQAQPAYAPVAAPAMTAPGVTPASGPVAMWQHGDDDIYPLGRKAGKGKRRG
ncbi:MAG: hypothetical protein ACR2H3_16380 [Acidimicrobiales bacterium]